MNLPAVSALSACLAMVAGPLAAASITLSSFNDSAYEAAVGAFGARVYEDFEGYGKGNVADGFATSVGRFSTLGGIGSGGTVTQADFADDGSQLALRDGSVYGRRSTTRDLSGDPRDRFFLDSNDTYGIRWDASLGGKMFDRVVLTLSDATDMGATMKISAMGAVTSFSGFGDGSRRMVEIDFGAPVSAASIVFANYRNGTAMLNDGFSLDDISVSLVPLPTAGLLLIGGLGGLAALRRRVRRA